MRLFNFLNENDHILDKIWDDIPGSFYKSIITTKKFIYRGTLDNIKTYEENIMRTKRSRTPLEMPLVLHKKLNEESTKKFGWPIRDGIFTTSSDENADIFGTPYLFFPASKNYKFVWSSKISDLNIWLYEHGEYQNIYHKLKEMEEYNSKIPENISIEVNKIVKDIIECYTDKNLNNAIESGNEIIFNTYNYILINTKYKEYFLS